MSPNATCGSRCRSWRGAGCRCSCTLNGRPRSSRRTRRRIRVATQRGSPPARREQRSRPSRCSIALCREFGAPHPRRPRRRCGRSAAAGRCARGRTAAHGGDLPALPDVLRGRNQGRTNPVQVRAADSRALASRGVVASARRRGARSRRDRSLALSAGDEGKRRFRRGLGRHRFARAVARRDLDVPRRRADSPSIGLPIGDVPRRPGWPVSAIAASSPPGARADLSSGIRTRAFVVDEETLRQRHKRTPYHGLPLRGRVRRPMSAAGSCMVMRDERVHTPDRSGVGAAWRRRSSLQTTTSSPRRKT